eukprot:5189094-Amphidinium_carterae.2
MASSSQKLQLLGRPASDSCRCSMPQAQQSSWYCSDPMQHTSHAAMLHGVNGLWVHIMFQPYALRQQVGSGMFVYHVRASEQTELDSN